MKKTTLLNILFLFAAAIILLVLSIAPEETTSHLPKDEIHLKFFPMKKKEAEKYCIDCHAPDKASPLPEDHPPKYRCLFCHKRE